MDPLEQVRLLVGTGKSSFFNVEVCFSSAAKSVSFFVETLEVKTFDCQFVERYQKLFGLLNFSYVIDDLLMF